jgi:molecular chaperone GrpE
VSASEEQVLEAQDDEPPVDTDETSAAENADSATESGDTGEAAAEEPAEPEIPLTPEQQITLMEGALIESQEKVLRVRAEFDNFRKRTHRDLADARLIGKTITIEGILPVVDHFGMAMMAIDQDNADIETLKQGMQMIQVEFERCLEGLGLEKISTVGERFDPNQHEGVSAEPSDDVPAEHIIREWKAGYRLGERLLRAATVVVSNGPESADKTTDDESATAPE